MRLELTPVSAFASSVYQLSGIAVLSAASLYNSLPMLLKCTLLIVGIHGWQRLISRYFKLTHPLAVQVLRFKNQQVVVTNNAGQKWTGSITAYQVMPWAIALTCYPKRQFWIARATLKSKLLCDVKAHLKGVLHSV